MCNLILDVGYLGISGEGNSMQVSCVFLEAFSWPLNYRKLDKMGLGLIQQSSSNVRIKA